jgi:hypothetical protein
MLRNESSNKEPTSPTAAGKLTPPHQQYNSASILRSPTKNTHSGSNGTRKSTPQKSISASLTNASPDMYDSGNLLRAARKPSSESKHRAAVTEDVDNDGLLKHRDLSKKPLTSQLATMQQLLQQERDFDSGGSDGSSGSGGDGRDVILPDSGAELAGGVAMESGTDTGSSDGSSSPYDSDSEGDEVRNEVRGKSPKIASSANDHISSSSDNGPGGYAPFPSHARESSHRTAKEIRVKQSGSELKITKSAPAALPPPPTPHLGGYSFMPTIPQSPPIDQQQQISQQDQQQGKQVGFTSASITTGDTKGNGIGEGLPERNWKESTAVTSNQGRPGVVVAEEKFNELSDLRDRRAVELLQGWIRRRVISPDARRKRAAIRTKTVGRDLQKQQQHDTANGTTTDGVNRSDVFELNISGGSTTNDSGDSGAGTGGEGGQKKPKREEEERRLRQALAFEFDEDLLIDRDEVLYFIYPHLYAHIYHSYQQTTTCISSCAL